MVKSGNYLRALRRRWHLTQEELAFLFGYTDHSIVSHLERQERPITLSVAYASHVLFGCESKDIFPAPYRQVEEGLAGRIPKMLEQLQLAKQTAGTSAKRQLLRQALTRLNAAPPQQNV